MLLCFMLTIFFALCFVELQNRMGIDVALFDALTTEEVCILLRVNGISDNFHLLVENVVNGLDWMNLVPENDVLNILGVSSAFDCVRG